jgi:hypothetical protein
VRQRPLFLVERTVNIAPPAERRREAKPEAFDADVAELAACFTACMTPEETQDEPHREDALVLDLLEEANALLSAAATREGSQRLRAVGATQTPAAASGNCTDPRD